MRTVDSGKEIVGCIIHARDDIGVALRIGGPEHHDIVKVVSRLEFADIGPDVLEMSGLVGTRDQVIDAVGLIGGYEVRV